MVLFTEDLQRPHRSARWRIRFVPPSRCWRAPCRYPSGALAQTGVDDDAVKATEFVAELAENDRHGVGVGDVEFGDGHLRGGGRKLVGEFVRTVDAARRGRASGPAPRTGGAMPSPRRAGAGDEDLLAVVR